MRRRTRVHRMLVPRRRALCAPHRAVRGRPDDDDACLMGEGGHVANVKRPCVKAKYSDGSKDDGDLSWWVGEEKETAAAKMRGQ